MIQDCRRYWRYGCKGVLAAGLLAGVAQASPHHELIPEGKVVIPLSHGETVNREDIQYQCHVDEQKASDDQKRLMTSLPPGHRFTVSYLNADMTALAVLPVDSKILVFANVISGSGAKYVADRYEWATEGEDASFSRVDREDDSITCHAVTSEGGTKPSASSTSSGGASQHQNKH